MDEITYDDGGRAWSLPLDTEEVHRLDREHVASVGTDGEIRVNQSIGTIKDDGPVRQRHVIEFMRGYMSMRCLHGIDGCDDRACICRCHCDEEEAGDG